MTARSACHMGVGRATGFESMGAKMLMAYEDLGFKIKDSTDDERVPVHPIDSLAHALQILEEAKKQRSDVQWEIVGNGPFGVHQKS
jgi:hypothetical protein